MNQAHLKAQFRSRSQTGRAGRIVFLLATTGWIISSVCWLTALIDSGMSVNPPEGDEWATIAAFALIAWTIASIVLQLRSSRAPLYVLARSPGFAAGCAVLIALSIGFVHAIQNWWYGRADSVPMPAIVAAIVAPYQIVFAVISTWFFLAVSRRWRTDAGGLDRVCVAMGATWIVIAYFQCR